MREKISAALKEAMKSKDAIRTSTLRLVTAAIKDRDIQARTEDGSDSADDAAIMSLLAKMIKQRDESAKIYEEGGRLDLAERERAEALIIQEFLPTPLTEAEVTAAIAAAIAESGATGVRDMGKVMALLKERFTGRIDFGKVGPKVKAALS